MSAGPGPWRLGDHGKATMIIIACLGSFPLSSLKLTDCLGTLLTEPRDTFSVGN